MSGNRPEINNGILVIPDDVTEIGESAFSGDKDLCHADLGNVTHVGACAFQDCSNLETVVMRNAAVIDSMAFSFCRSLRSITVGGIEEIGDSAFLHCDKLDIEKLPETISVLGAGAFSHTALKKADLHWLSEIPDSLFLNCISLERTDVSGARVIGKSSFEGCESLKQVKFGPAEVIGGKAFHKCSSFVPVRIPETLKSIGDEAFWIVRDGLTVPKCVKYFGHNCFGPVMQSRKICIYSSALHDFANYFVVRNVFEEEHYYLQESAVDVTVIDDETGQETGYLPLYSDLEPELRDALARAFRPDNSFDYSILDGEFFAELRWNQRGRDRLAVLRLKHPYGLTEEARNAYIDYMVRHSRRIAERAVKAADIEMLVFLYDNSMIQKEDITPVLDASISAEAYECTAFLLKCQSEMSGYSDELFDEL